MLFKGNRHFKTLALSFFLLVLMGLSTYAQDSSKVKLFGIKPNRLQLAPLTLKGDSLQLQMNFLEKKNFRIPQNAIDLHEYMPPNHLFWDYRESSYYTPWYVKEKIARIMDRPMPGEVFPILPVALIAARLALQRLKIDKLIAIKPEDYLLPKKYWPILKAIWKKHPQSAYDLYQIKEIQRGRTMETLKNDLQFLVDRKLLKPKKIPGSSMVYYPGQSRGKAILLLDKALQDDRYSLLQKKQWIDFRNYLINGD